jgi:2-oxo-4-hydroxy-4-carboxy-5-ureidoimidazoline decarboxylase
MTSVRSTTTALAQFNSADAEAAAAGVTACCAAPSFVRAIVAGRPYDSLEAVSTTVDAAFARLGWPDVAEALAGHPRIGDRAASGWPAGEQAGVAGASTSVRTALADGNRAYEQRFGHVFLICATGLSADQMLAALHARLDHDPATERRVVAEELRKITQLRMRKLLGG